MIVFDLDGTILDNDLKISHNLIEICCDLKITTKIVIATGRSVSDAIQYYRILDLDTYLICYNGAFIWHPLTKKVYQNYYMDQWREILKFVVCKRHELFIHNIIVSQKENTFLLNKHNDYLIDIMVDEKLPYDYICENDMIELGNIHRIVLGVESEFRENIEKLIKLKFPIIDVFGWKGRSDVIDISLPNMNKWEAIKKVAKIENEQKEKIIVFGDARNDMEMIKNADVGIAVKNASVEVQNVANYVTVNTNNEDGVAQFIINNSELFI